ncbi:MAG: hypothetical protein K0R38_607 [Polyangiaceae bacterium]|nr:hypothetical protein [Polyangiaceae bacterium]
MGPHYSLQDATFLDLKTNLRWQRSATPAPPGGTAWSEPGNGSFDLADAQRYCADLELEGERDWRVPSVLELLSLVRPNISQPSSDARDYVHLDPSVVPAETLEQAIFYSQTLFGAKDAPWIVDFERDTWPASYGFSARRTLCVAGR